MVSLVQLVHATAAEAAQSANERSKYILIYSPKSSTEPLIRDITISLALFSRSSRNSQVVAIWRKDREKEKDKEREEVKKEVREGRPGSARRLNRSWDLL